MKGVHASIDEYHPYVTAGSASLMWVMLNAGTTKWSQIGWWQTPSTHQVFEQHTDASGNWFTSYWPGQTGAATDYKVIASVGSHGLLTWTFYLAGAVKSTSTRLWSPNGYQLYGETHNKGDQMAGGFTNLTTKAAFAGSQKQDSGSVWSSVTTAAGANSTLYGAQLASNTYYPWDWACPS